MNARPSHRRLRALATVFTVLTAGIIARADAPPDQYEQYGPSDATITDTLTGLTWQRSAVLASTFASAVSYCASLSPYGTPPDETSWRAPSYKELLTLVDESPHYEYVYGTTLIAIDGHAFPYTKVDQPYWTSSADPQHPASQVYVVDFTTGAGSSWPLGGGGYVRCVTP
jgi:hypothetical protein